MGVIVAWLVLGLLGWAWTYHVVTKSDPNGPDDSAVAKCILMALLMMMGPFALLIAVGIAWENCPQNRIGLRFW